MNVIGALPPPCVIIHVSTDRRLDDVKAVVSRHTESILVGVEPEPRWQSCDVLVAVGGRNRYPSADGLRIIKIGGSAPGAFDVTWEDNRSSSSSPMRTRRPGHELVIPSTLSDARREFVERYLLPVLPQNPVHRSVFEMPLGASEETWRPAPHQYGWRSACGGLQAIGRSA